MFTFYTSINSRLNCWCHDIFRNNSSCKLWIMESEMELSSRLATWFLLNNAKILKLSFSTSFSFIRQQECWKNWFPSVMSFFNPLSSTRSWAAMLADAESEVQPWIAASWLVIWLLKCSCSSSHARNCCATPSSRVWSAWMASVTKLPLCWPIDPSATLFIC